MWCSGPPLKRLLISYLVNSQKRLEIHRDEPHSRGTVRLIMRRLCTCVTYRRCRSVLAACVVGFSPALAFAQATPPAPAPPPPAREGSLEFAYVGTTGNASTETIGLGGELILRPDRWVVRNKAAFVRNESDATLTAESITYLFRAERVLSTRSSAFGDTGTSAMSLPVSSIAMR